MVRYVQCVKVTITKVVLSIEWLDERTLFEERVVSRFSHVATAVVQVQEAKNRAEAVSLHNLICYMYMYYTRKLCVGVKPLCSPVVLYLWLTDQIHDDHC